MKKDDVFKKKVQKWTVDDLLKVAGGGPYTGIGGKTGSGQDNSGHSGFY